MKGDWEMQVIPSESIMPHRLTCSGCQHWERVTTHTLGDTEPMGRCGRFGETRAASARPRCNICWEPASITLAAQDGMLADH